MQPVLRAIRGAITVEADKPELIRGATAELLQEILKCNDVAYEDLVCIFFSATADLHSAFPATGARDIGFNDVPLFGSTEISVTDAVERCIRVMVQCYSTKERSEIHHVYRKGAVSLRADLAD